MARLAHFFPSNLGFAQLALCWRCIGAVVAQRWLDAGGVDWRCGGRGMPLIAGFPLRNVHVRT